MHIGELLIQEGHLTRDGLEEALDWQVLYGGRLGTNLLELQLVEEAQLARALGKQRGCEVTWGPIAVAPEMISLVPGHVADRQELVPWKVEKRRIKVLCAEIKLEALDELGYKLGRACVAVMAPEFRIFNLLRAHYAAKRQMRALDFGVVPTEGREERRRKKQRAEKGGAAEPPPELIDESAFNDIYNQVLAGRGLAPAQAPEQPVAPPPPPAAQQRSAPSPTPMQAAPVAPLLEPRSAPMAAPVALAQRAQRMRAPVPASTWNPAATAHPAAPPVMTPNRGVAPVAPAPVAPRAPARAQPPPAPPPLAIHTAPQPKAPAESAESIVVEAELVEQEAELLPDGDVLEELPEGAIVGEDDAESDSAGEFLPVHPIAWEEPAPPAAPRDESPIAFAEALRLLEGVTDRDEIALIVLRASRSKAARALLLTVQGGVALGWEGLGDGVSGGAARSVAVPLSAQSAFQLVVNTRSHFMGPLQKTPSNIRFLAATGKQIPLSSLLFPILYRGRVSHLLYLDNGHKQQAPTDVGEMLILSQRIAQSVEALVERKRRGA